jgi:hypothetical protein
VKAARAQAPAGIVTMLFTDIEGSSDSVRARGADRWALPLAVEVGLRADVDTSRIQMEAAAFNVAFREGRANAFLGGASSRR